MTKRATKGDVLMAAQGHMIQNEIHYFPLYKEQGITKLTLFNTTGRIIKYSIKKKKITFEEPYYSLYHTLRTDNGGEYFLNKRLSLTEFKYKEIIKPSKKGGNLSRYIPSYYSDTAILKVQQQFYNEYLNTPEKNLPEYFILYPVEVIKIIQKWSKISYRGEFNANSIKEYLVELKKVKYIFSYDSDYNIYDLRKI